MTNNLFARRTVRPSQPSVALSALPIVGLLGSLIVLIVSEGAQSVQDYAPWMLLSVSAVAALLTWFFTSRPMRLVAMGCAKSARQILPALPLLMLIATLSTTWMLSGVVPYMIDAGIAVLNPSWFLVVTCAVCAVVSVMTGSSWTTIATLGVAFIGIGRVMGYSEGWVAGAIISGAYFGDKISPLSDTTVLAASSCGLDLFRHIRFLIYTTAPAMVVALAVFGAVGWIGAPADFTDAGAAIRGQLGSVFNLTPWVLIIPAITLALILFRVNSLVTLAIGSLAGLAGMWIFQPSLTEAVQGGVPAALSALKVLASGAEIATGDPQLNELVATSGIGGMIPTMLLVSCAMVFGGLMIGSGMLATLTRSFTRMLRRPGSLVGATVASGLFLNSCTGDQYLSIIIGGNIYRSSYRRHNLADEMLSRSLEDSISVTSVLIPWNSCGLTQSSVLGVATLTYLPYCIFNIMSPVLSVAYAWIGFKIRRREPLADTGGAVTLQTVSTR